MNSCWMRSSLLANVRFVKSVFRIGVTRDFLNPAGELGFGDIGLSLLDDADGVEWEFLEENTPELSAAQVAPYDGLLVLMPAITATTLAAVERLRVIARFGVGYDSVDVAACDQAGVALTIAPDGVRRPVAASAMTFLLGLSHKLIVKDRLTREGRWEERLNYMGQGVTGRTLGVIGLGNIGVELLKLAAPFGMKHVGYDPYVDEETLNDVTVEQCGLDELMAQSDYVVICCTLTSETKQMIDLEKLRLMKSNAYLINVARGPVVDQAALTKVLQEGAIQGAALDVFETEPVDPADPIMQLDNVILAPHAGCWTDEMFSGIGRDACGGLLAVAAGRRPRHVVNPGVFAHSRLANLK